MVGLSKIKWLVLLMFLFNPIVSYGNNFKLVNDKSFIAHQNDAINPTDYQTLLKQLHRSYLWFDDNQRSLNGLTLHRLLSDLGFPTLSEFRSLNRHEYGRQDHALTNGLILLLKTSGTVTNNNLAIEHLKSAFENQTVEELIHSIVPKYQQFNQLRLALNFYNDLLKRQWPELNDSFTPRLGQSHKSVQAIRKRLALLGDLPAKAQTESRLDVYDSVAVKSLQGFQLRHGLKADGKLGPSTYRALNVSPAERVKQLQVNLWRWFALPTLPPNKFLLVNIPQYQLSVFEAGQQTFEMKVIVGDRGNQTPQMVTEINQITLNPSWTPTRKIIKNDIIPEYQQDYLSLKRKNFSFVKGYWHNIEVREIDSPNLNFDTLLQTFRLVQAPGENNALGAFRFNIPNNQSIYLHDTPVKSLFKRRDRALSHGCVRLEDAQGLATYLLKDDNKPRMLESLKTGKTKKLTLNQPIVVYITYQTAWVDDQGVLQLAPDIYQLDHNYSLFAI